MSWEQTAAESRPLPCGYCLYSGRAPAQRRRGGGSRTQVHSKSTANQGPLRIGEGTSSSIQCLSAAPRSAFSLSQSETGDGQGRTSVMEGKQHPQCKPWTPVTTDQITAVKSATSKVPIQVSKTSRLRGSQKGIEGNTNSSPTTLRPSPKGKRTRTWGVQKNP